MLIVFVSTPIVIFANVKKTNADLFNLKFTENMYGGSFIETNFPPLCVITINIALLYLIDFAALYEYHETHSLYQKSVLTKTLIYLTLNMIMIPALTLSNTSIELDKKMTVNTQVETANSLWQFFKMKNFNFTQILGEIYVGDNGLFFVSLVFMQAAVSFSYYLLQFQDFINAHFSPWLAVMKRQVYQDTEPWLRKEGNNFMYGYHYASMLTIFGICIFFSSTVPMVSVASAFYAGTKHLVDGLNLITVHRKEIDSQGQLIDVATNAALIFVVLY